MVICLERGADLNVAQLMPLPLTVSCFSKIQIGLPFWYRLTWAVPDKGPLNGCVCVCYRLILERVKLLTWTATSTTQVGTVSCNIVCSASPPASLHSSRYWVLPPTSLHTYIHTHTVTPPHCRHTNTQTPHLAAYIHTHTDTPPHCRHTHTQTDTTHIHPHFTDTQVSVAESLAHLSAV